MHSSGGDPLQAAGVRTALDDERVAADADQTTADADQTVSDDDASASDRDQASSEADQRLSDQDQAAADEEHADDPEPEKDASYFESRADRARVSEKRHATQLDRSRTGIERDASADSRDANATLRDERASERDAMAGEREESIASLDADTARKFEHLRRQAATDRADAARDRARAARDRAEAARERARYEAELMRAHVDDLTGAYRREVGCLALSHEIDRARRGDGRFVVAFVDLDGLKSINDLNGHAAGDAALKAVVDALRANLRSFDPVLRYGGDEFVAGMGGVDFDDAERRFEAIKVTLRQDAAVGISVGIAALAMGETLDELIARADSALLRRRRSARDSTPAG